MHRNVTYEYCHLNVRCWF